MISNLQKELIAIEVIRTLYNQFEKFPEDATKNRNAPFHEAFLNAFSEKLEGKVISIPIFISLASWMHGLNTSLGQSFLEKTSHILSNGEKKEFTTKKGTTLKISENQKRIINNIITDLTNGNRNPDMELEETECVIEESNTIFATDFTVDIYYEDANKIICIELKTVKPNKGVFKVEKQKILESKVALKNIHPSKSIKYFLGFPFDPLNDFPTGFNKQRFMDYSVGFRKYFAEEEILLSSELWDYLSGNTQTMETLLEIINSIANPKFIENYNFVNNRENYLNNTSEYLKLIKGWFLFREKELIDKDEILQNKISLNNLALRIYNQSIFKNDGSYNDNRYTQLINL
jgi:hypothetical protein